MRRAVALAVLVAAYLALRLPALGLLPLYSDEAIGLWRAERVLEGSLTRGAGEGKPLHAWMVAAALSLPADPILAARAAHGVAGALLVLALWDVARRRLSPAVAWTAAAMWCVLPFPALFERTVTPDVPLAAAAVAVVACGLRVVSPEPRESQRWIYALLAAGFAATFVKMPIGLLVAALPLLLPWTLPAEARPAARSRLRVYVVALAVVAATLTTIVAARAALGLRPLGFGLHELALKVAAVREPEQGRGALIENLHRAGEYAWLYLGPAATVLLVLGVAGAWLLRQRLLCVLTAFALAWTVLFVVNARDLSAHYLLAAVPFYVLAMAWAVVEGASAVAGRLRSRATAAIVALAVLGIAAGSWPLLSALWHDPARARLAATERRHYVEGPWSGYGLAEAARWIERELAAERRDTLFVALHIADYERLRRYAAPHARAAIVQIQIDRYTLPARAMIERAQTLLASGRRVVVVVGSEQRFSGRWRDAFPGASRLVRFPKPGGIDAVEVWELGP